MRIHITGASGSGVTTLGAALGAGFGWNVADGDDFYWLPTTPRFTQARAPEERLALALAALGRSEHAVFSGSCVGWGSGLED